MDSNAMSRRANGNVTLSAIPLAAWMVLRSFCRATWRWTARAVGAAAVWLLCSATSWAADLPVMTWQGQTMGCVYTVKIVGTNVTSAPLEVIKTAIEHRLQEVNRQMSHYQKFFLDAQGHRLSHIFDPRTGWPVQHDVGGVSVVAPDATTADALATTLFVLGCTEGMRFVESWTNAAALFIVREPDGRFRTIPSSRFPVLVNETP